jgi:hypothetical protein
LIPDREKHNLPISASLELPRKITRSSCLHEKNAHGSMNSTDSGMEIFSIALLAKAFSPMILRMISFEFTDLGFHGSVSFANWLCAISSEMQSQVQLGFQLSKCFLLREMEYFFQEAT